MLPKPDACKGCPLYGTGRGFVPDELRPGSPILVYGQNPGEDEEREGRPFVGKTGALMESEYLKRAGTSREEVSIGNAIRCRWKLSNELPPLEQTVAQEALDHCTKAHFQLPESTRIIVAQGAYALSALTGEITPTDWRGYLLPLRLAPSRNARRFNPTGVWLPDSTHPPILATLHLAALFRDPSMVLATQADWGKVARYLRGQWPRPCPPVVESAPLIYPSVISFDTEYHRETHDLYHFSVAWQTDTGEPRIHSVPLANHAFPQVLPTTLITQNAWADYRHIRRVFGPSELAIDDTMLAHACLYPDQPHDLNYLGSIYSSMNRWKHLIDVPGAKIEYAGADAWGTWEVRRALWAEFNADPQSFNVYKSYVQPLIPIIDRATAPGIRTDPRRVQTAEAVMLTRLNQASAEAQAACGWPINLGSNPQVGHHLYEVLGFPEGKKRRRK